MKVWNQRNKSTWLLLLCIALIQFTSSTPLVAIPRRYGVQKLVPRQDDERSCRSIHNLDNCNVNTIISKLPLSVHRGGAMSRKNGQEEQQQQEVVTEGENDSEETSSQKMSGAVVNGMKSFVASGMAAACSKTLLAPFDTIKTMQQQVRTSSITGSLGLLEAARMIMRRPKGFLELYAGLGVSALGAMPSVGLYFGVYSYSKDQIGPLLQKNFGHQQEQIPTDNDKNNSATGSEQKQLYLSDDLIRTITVATSAAIGNTVASFSRVPYEVVKQKLQTGQYTSTMGAIGDMFKKEGMRAFFPMGGVSIQMIRDIPYAIFTLLSYEYLREHWVMKQKNAQPGRDMVAGGLAGGIGSLLTNPMDVIKTRIQTDPQIYNGAVWECTRATYAEGGAAAFMRGSVPRLIHKIPANAAFFVFYELFRRLLQVEEQGKTAK